MRRHWLLFLALVAAGASLWTFYPRHGVDPEKPAPTREPPAAAPVRDPDLTDSRSVDAERAVPSVPFAMDGAAAPSTAPRNDVENLAPSRPRIGYVRPPKKEYIPTPERELEILDELRKSPDGLDACALFQEVRHYESAETLQALLELARESPVRLVRTGAVNSLGLNQRFPTVAVQVILERARSDPDKGVRDSAISSLACALRGRRDHPLYRESLDAVLWALKHDEETPAAGAARALRTLLDPSDYLPIVKGRLEVEKRELVLLELGFALRDVEKALAATKAEQDR